VLSRILEWFTPKAVKREAPSVIDHEKVELLDAEDLAELGIKRAYDGIVQKYPNYFPKPVPVEEKIEEDLGRYALSFGGENIRVSGGGTEEWEKYSWGRASFVFFRIINHQLRESGVTFYALYGGNDLGGVFLTDAQFQAARAELKDKRQWPYLPTEEAPWFGEPH
jgi:hypothetical protein